MRLAEEIIKSRRSGRRLSLSPAVKPTMIEKAYAIQRRVAGEDRRIVVDPRNPIKVEIELAIRWSRFLNGLGGRRIASAACELASSSRRARYARRSPPLARSGSKRRFPRSAASPPPSR